MGLAEPGSVSRPPHTPSAPQVSTKNTRQAGLPLERRPNSNKGFATKISNLPNPPNLPLHSQTVSHPVKSLYPKILAE